MAKQICASCAEPFEGKGEICDTCHENYMAIRAILFAANGQDSGDSSKESPCTHDCKWDYHTQEITDEYGNEGSIDKWVCSQCGEVMEEERTS